MLKANADDTGRGAVIGADVRSMMTDAIGVPDTPGHRLGAAPSRQRYGGGARAVTGISPGFVRRAEPRAENGWST